jgi:Ribonuclease G/E
MCAGSGRAKSAITAAHESLRAALTEARRGIDRRPKITAAPAVIAALAKDAAPALRETEAKLGRRIILEENPAVSSQMFTVTLAGDREE